MKKTILLTIGILFIASIGLSETQIKGKDMICQKINYLSTSCENANAVPMEYYDKEIALEKAKQNITINKTNNSTSIINKELKKEKAIKTSKEKNEIIVKTWFEKE